MGFVSSVFSHPSRQVDLSVSACSFRQQKLFGLRHSATFRFLRLIKPCALNRCVVWCGLSNSHNATADREMNNQMASLTRGRQSRDYYGVLLVVVMRS
ncbi:hypothetical protein RRG08_050035 [Elysia crispata]|uniref:Uncharacterized protein n=1 Tax=Elysia crispata TaxID=231223 RepID=A0AAE1B994_9GAST|nr:hypothetical protein RRG08_050035 [Elysia crispata]